MKREDLVYELIKAAQHDGLNIQFDRQYDIDGFVDKHGTFYAVEGHSIPEICQRIGRAYAMERVPKL